MFTYAYKLAGSLLTHKHNVLVKYNKTIGETNNVCLRLFIHVQLKFIFYMNGMKAWCRT